MNAERGFRRLAAVGSLLILILGSAAVAFSWMSERTSWRVATTNPPGAPVGYVVGGGFFRFPDGFSEAEIAQGFTHLEETLQLEPKSGDAFREQLRAQHSVVGYVYLPGALPGALDPPPGYVLDKILPSSGELLLAPDTLTPSPGIPLQAKPEVVRAIRKKYPGVYAETSDADLAKAVAKTYPQLGRGRLWSRKALLEDEARQVLPPAVREAIAKLRTNDLLPYGQSRPAFGGHLLFLVGVIGAATLPWILFFVVRWIVRGFGGES